MRRDADFLRAVGIEGSALPDSGEPRKSRREICRCDLVESAWSCAEFWMRTAGVYRRWHGSVCQALLAAAVLAAVESVALAVILIRWAIARWWA